MLQSRRMKVREKFLIFGNPLIEEDEIAEVVASLRSGWIGTGPKVQLFEEMFRNFTGARFAMALNSCTAALHLSPKLSDEGMVDVIAAARGILG